MVVGSKTRVRIICGSTVHKLDARRRLVPGGCSGLSVAGHILVPNAGFAAPRHTAFYPSEAVGMTCQSKIDQKSNRRFFFFYKAEKKDVRNGSTFCVAKEDY